MQDSETKEDSPLEIARAALAEVLELNSSAVIPDSLVRSIERIIGNTDF